MMNQDDRKKIDISEAESTKATSRRGFLSIGAATVVGATVAGIIPGDAKADHDQGGGVHDPNGRGLNGKGRHKNPKLRDVILEAWRTWDDPGGFKSRLLDPDTTRAALSEFGVDEANPKVLTRAQYNQGYHKADVTEIVYVLPDPPVGGNPTAEAARAMAAVPFGM